METKRIKYDFENLMHRTTVIDACYSIGKPFNSMDIQNYIRKNDANGNYFDWHDLSMALDLFREHGAITFHSHNSNGMTIYTV